MRPHEHFCKSNARRKSGFPGVLTRFVRQHQRPLATDDRRTGRALPSHGWSQGSEATPPKYLQGFTRNVLKVYFLVGLRTSAGKGTLHRHGENRCQNPRHELRPSTSPHSREASASKNAASLTLPALGYSALRVSGIRPAAVLLGLSPGTLWMGSAGL